MSEETYDFISSVQSRITDSGDVLFIRERGWSAKNVENKGEKESVERTRIAADAQLQGILGNVTSRGSPSGEYRRAQRLFLDRG